MDSNYSNWQEIVSSSITDAEGLAKCFDVDKKSIQRIIELYPVKINPYYLSLIKKKGDPLWKQAVPDIQEIENNSGLPDPLLEEFQSPVDNLIHRYPDRALLLVSGRCAMYCRFCMRKRRTGDCFNISKISIVNGIDYIKNNKSINEVILSGGDPFMLEDATLKEILSQLHGIAHVNIIRVHTRIPCTLPQRITKSLADMLKNFHPLYVNVHFNHPDEITKQAALACSILADAGIPLGNQTVLLNGVNDKPAVMKKLMQKLLTIRVRPYYIHHPDKVKGTGHFNVKIENGLNIIKSLRGHTSGLCVPHYMLDIQGGEGKVSLSPNYIKEYKGHGKK